MAITARQKQIGIAGVAAVSAAAGGGFLLAILPQYLGPALRGALVIVVIIGLFLATLPRWRRLDHMQRDSRLASWYWGGGYGWGVGLLLALVFAGVRSPLFAGAALVSSFQFAGYAVARLHWWLVHRSDAP